MNPFSTCLGAYYIEFQKQKSSWRGVGGSSGFFCHVLGIAITNLTQIWYLPCSPGIQPYSPAFWNSSLHFGIPADHSLHKSKQNWALPSPYSFCRNLTHALVTCGLRHCHCFQNRVKLLLFTEWSPELAHLPVCLLHFDKDGLLGRGRSPITSQHLPPARSLIAEPWGHFSLCLITEHFCLKGHKPWALCVFMNSPSKQPQSRELEIWSTAVGKAALAGCEQKSLNSPASQSC